MEIKQIFNRSPGPGTYRSQSEFNRSGHYSGNVTLSCSVVGNYNEENMLEISKIIEDSVKARDGAGFTKAIRFPMRKEIDEMLKSPGPSFYNQNMI